VKAYAAGLYLTEPAIGNPQVLADEAAAYIGQGFQAVKMKVGFGVEADVAAVRTVREAIGDDIALMVDANHAYDVTTAIRLGRTLQQYDVGWFEEPVVPEDLDGYCTVRQALDVPIAGGEAEFTRYGFRELISRGAVDIAQPDICISGGISEARRVAVLAQTWGVRCVPRRTCGAPALPLLRRFISSLPCPRSHPRCAHSSRCWSGIVLKTLSATTYW